jgi:hypothetical protein
MYLQTEPYEHEESLLYLSVVGDPNDASSDFFSSTD